MTEPVREVSAGREEADILMAAFGAPDTINTLTLAVTGTSAAITTLKPAKWYRFVANQDVHLHFHPTDPATTSHMFVKSGVPEIFYTGENARVAAIQNSANGTLWATPMQTNDRAV